MATCVPIQLARSDSDLKAVEEYYLKKHPNEEYPGFNLGTCIEYLSEKNDNNNYNYETVWFTSTGLFKFQSTETIDPSFAYQKIYYNLTTEQINELCDGGYYLIAEVAGYNYLTHYVAITGVNENNVVEIIDPASDKTYLDDSFYSKNIYFAYKKVDIEKGT